MIRYIFNVNNKIFERSFKTLQQFHLPLNLTTKKGTSEIYT